MLDLLCKGGQVIDGLGTPMYRADVGVRDGRIVAMGDLSSAEASRTLDCTRRCVSPGWVDIHGHADNGVFDHPSGLNLLMQGCTLTVAGNCGFAPAPVVGRAMDLMKQGKVRDVWSHKAVPEIDPGGGWSMAQFLHAVESSQLGVNYVQLAGHYMLRRCVMGDDPRQASDQEIEEMKSLLIQSLEEGAFGMSTGLVFIPGCWSDTREIIALAKVVGEHDGLYASHIRGERETAMEATQEFIETAERGRVRAQMSHMQSKYPRFGDAVQKIEMLEQARRRGVDVAVDSDAYPGTGAGLGSFLQIYNYTQDELLEKLRSPAARAEIKHTMRTIDPWHPQGRFGPGGVPYRRAYYRVVIYDCPGDRSIEGKSIATLAALRGQDPEDALFDLTLEHSARGLRMIQDYIEDDHLVTAPWEHCIYPMVDEYLYDPATKFSEVDLRYLQDTGLPGGIGRFPNVLGRYVREEKLMTVEEAVRKMSSLPMQRLGITDRGVIRPGMWADLVVFDKETIALRSPDADPKRLETFYPVGIDYVVVNGQIAMEGHRYTGVSAGQVLRAS
jgi:N-acyl-D-amino-acid deacylase